MKNRKCIYMAKEISPNKRKLRSSEGFYAVSSENSKEELRSKEHEEKEDEEGVKMYRDGRGLLIHSHLFLGDAKVGRNMEWLKENNISLIINLTKCHNNDIKASYKQNGVTFQRHWFEERDLHTFTKKANGIFEAIHTALGEGKS